MANLPGSIKNLNTLLGEQLTEGGGGGGAEPLIVKFVKSETSPDVIRLDHTCGEIRQAVLNGRSVIRESDEAGIQVTTLSRVAWEVYEGGASFTIEEGDFGYGAALSEPPYTLEALDAEYPYTTD